MSLPPIAERSERSSIDSSADRSGSVEGRPSLLTKAQSEDWEHDSRAYIFEERLETGTMHKDIGNEHFKRGEWDVALRRYERALYHCTFDPMQMYDLMEKHKAAAYAVQTPVKLNYVACVLKCREAGLHLAPIMVEGEEEPREPLDRCEELLQEVLKAEPDNAKAHFRRAQLLRERADVKAARDELATAEKLAGSTASLLSERTKLNAMAKEERERERQLFSGKIQATSKAAEEAALAARRAANHRRVALLLSPFTTPMKLLWKISALTVAAFLKVMAKLQAWLKQCLASSRMSKPHRSNERSTREPMDQHASQ